MQLLEWLHPELANWERQRRMRSMMSPDDRYMDGPQLNLGGMFYDSVPRSPITNQGNATRPALGHPIMPYYIEENPSWRKQKTM